ncbi:MAG: acyl-CoA dehydrogenase family protein [bacterium]
MEKLIDPCYETNFTGAQFVTEIQGGSDVGLNDTLATLDSEGKWRVQGEKWFCSNANAELLLMTARYDESVSGTKGLGLFLVPAKLSNGEKNHYKLRRLEASNSGQTQRIATATDPSQSVIFGVAKFANQRRCRSDGAFELRVEPAPGRITRSSMIENISS